MEAVSSFIERIFENQYQQAFGPVPSLASQTDEVTLTREIEGQLIAVLQAKITLQNAHVTALVVDEGHHGQGLGADLMAELEELARTRQLTSITLSTKSYQAEGFYRKLGYQIYGQLQDVPQKGMTKYHFVKYL
ncbi:N-acetyltransferase [Streptococcus merionis]|uniref:GNAT family N-acetyltransferase n=1 Tax=Streptococcus merionis TaxID=400065 RepID=UPI0026E9F9DE|nr:GNAT family N-acetyltransferase [Streptococcus merionis]